MSDWDQLVERGRALVETHSRACWELGDLALEAVPMVGTGGVDQGVKRTLTEYAEAIGITTAYLSDMRLTANAFPPEARASNASFTAHLILANAGVADCGEVMRKMAQRAEKRGRRVTCTEAREMARRAGRYAEHNRRVEVRQYARHAPGEASWSQADIDAARSMLTNGDYRRRLLRRMTIKQLGSLIDDAWAVLEAEKVAA